MGIGTSSKEDEEEESEQVPCSFPFWYEGRWRFECVRRTELESEDFWCPLTAGNNNTSAFTPDQIVAKVSHFVTHLVQRKRWIREKGSFG